MAETSVSAEEIGTLDYLRKLDARITRMEAHLALPPLNASSSAERPQTEGAEGSGTECRAAHAESSGLELRLGEFGLAWIGSVILLLGVAFLLTYTSGLGHQTLAGFLGYLATCGLYFLARTWKEEAPYLSQTMLSGSLVLLYYSTMRLHYFSGEPLIGSATIVLPALFLVVAFQLFLALKLDSQSIAVLFTLMAIITGFLSDTPQIGLPVLAVLSALAVLIALRRGWWSFLNLALAAVYCGFLLWLLGNPLAGHPLGAIDRSLYNPVYLFVSAAVFLCPVVLRDLSTEPRLLLTVFLNSAGFSLLLSLVAFVHYQNQVFQLFSAGAVLFLLASIVQWVKTHRQLVPAIYACFGFLALSVAAYGYSQAPAFFLWLSLESLLVISVALWFRSKLLVVANSVIFLAVLASYVSGFPSSDWVNFSFALVGHLSARIMNWKKQRLTLQTELLRNVYLSIGFVFVLYGLYHALPGHYVTVSWIAAAGCYFLISVFLKNVKYRWLAVASVMVTIVYLFLVDLVRLDAQYRVPAFLFVGIMSLVLSLYYTKFRRLLGKAGD